MSIVVNSKTKLSACGGTFKQTMTTAYTPSLSVSNFIFFLCGSSLCDNRRRFKKDNIN